MDKELRVLENQLDYNTDSYRPSWNGKWFSGIAYEEDEFGVVLSETVYVDGKRNGYTNEFYFDGTQVKSGFYKNDKAYGLWRYFYDTGALKKIEMYCLTKKLIFRKEWDIEGNLTHASYYDKFGPILTDTYSKEQIFESGELLISEKIYESDFLVKQKDWNLNGELLTHWELDESSPKYAKWQKWKITVNVSNQFTFSK